MSSVYKLIELRESEGISKLRKKILEEIPQLNKIATEIKGRKVKIEGRWIIDFASCNYLGFDLEQEIIDSILPEVKKWGVHPSWTRIVASPEIYIELEKELAKLIKAKDILVFQTITLIHEGVLPIFAKDDSVILMDKFAHRSIYEACRIAVEGGAEFIQLEHSDSNTLKEYLEKYQDKKVKIIALDGIYSMSGDYPNLPEYVKIAKDYDAIIYVDDAHGFGVIGESPDENNVYGHKGNGIVQYFGLNYEEDNIIYVSGLSKAYSSLGAFISCPPEMKDLLRSASTYIFSGPCPTASLASALAGIKLNEKKGDILRQKIYKLTSKLIKGARELGFEVDNRTYFPIVTVIVGSPKTVMAACQIAWEHGILITPAIFPAVPINRGALRFSITAANTEEEIDTALESLEEIMKMIKKKKQEDSG